MKRICTDSLVQAARDVLATVDTSTLAGVFLLGAVLSSVAFASTFSKWI